MKAMLDELRRCGSWLLRACIDRRVWNPAIPSVGTPSSSNFELSSCPSGSCREMFKRYTPEKIIRKPQSSEMVLTASVVLNPLNRMKEAQRVAVVNVT